MNKVFLYVTAETVADAIRIGRALVEARLAACANVLPGMTSIYRWQGAVTEAAETVLILKTREELAEAAVERIKALHAYACPCVAIVPVTGGNADFLTWIESETS